MENSADHRILELCRNSVSANAGFKLLITKYQSQVYWLIRRMVLDHEDANDLVQETFIKVWKNLNSFREDSSLFTWIYRVATNEALSFLQRKKLKFSFLIRNYDQHLANMLKDDYYFSGDEIELKLQKAILTLPKKQRLIFNLRYFDELTYDEMSEILGTSVGGLKATYHIAVRKIEKIITLN